MTKAEEIFNIKAEYNKWLKELTDDEKELVLEMINEAFRQPLVIGSVCTCTNFRETPIINGKHICSICNKPIAQTDL